MTQICVPRSSVLDLAIGNVMIKMLVEEKAFDGPSVNVNGQWSV